MRKLALYTLILGIATSMVLSTSALAAHHENPCNPCAKHFTVNDNRNVVTFESKAPLEKIVGTTSKITGHVHADPKDVTKGMMAKFELDLASLNTGIGLRDEHMRDNFLETKKYPKAMLTVDKITKASNKMLMDQKPITVNAEGTLELHGVKQKIQLENVQVTYFKESEATKGKMPGNLLHIAGGFSVKLPDYNIKVPQMIVLKLDENIHINVDVFGTTAMMNPCNPCNPCAKKNPCNPCAKKNPCKGK